MTFDEWWIGYAANDAGGHGIAYWSLTRVAAEDAWNASQRQISMEAGGFAMRLGAVLGKLKFLRVDSREHEYKYRDWRDALIELEEAAEGKR